LILSAIFWALERWRPSIRQLRRAPADTRTDLVYWFFTPLVTRAATRIALDAVFALLAISQGLTLADLRHAVTERQTSASSLPVAVQVPLMLVLANLLAYWTHRLFHGRRRLPRFWYFVEHAASSVAPTRHN
jgi:sterol desaturase/sphingolipid hydroxylase (fatty acid hydroxylase superfamily)